jgi:mycofactocin precursor
MYSSRGDEKFLDSRVEGVTMTDDQPVLANTEAADDLLVEDLLVEEVSIDGMCGVY